MSYPGTQSGRLRRHWPRPARTSDSGPALPLATSHLHRFPGGGAVVLAVTAVVGFLLVSQMGTSPRFSQRLEAESEEDLARILASLTNEADSLRDEISDLKLQLVDLRASTRQDDSANRAAREQLQGLSVLAGTVAVTGPGLVLVIDDPDDAVRYDALIDAVQELRDAGAEALAINDRRVGVASFLADRDGRILLDGTVLVPPYRVAAIGQSTTLDGALKIPGGVLDALDALPGVRARVQRSAKLDLPATTRAGGLEVARPVGSAP